MARVSLCMIARDEEELLPGCLSSVEGAVDEIVLVDTGSRDRTVALAAAAGAKVLHRPWDDDFAAPRNLAAANATGDWLLQLDADERLAPGQGRTLRKAVRKGGFDVGLVRLHNAARLGLDPAAVIAGRGRIGEPIHLPRVLRAAARLEFTGAVHEGVGHAVEAGRATTRRLDLDLVHLGYVDELWRSRGKKGRNLALLRKRVALEPDDAVPAGYLAIELVGDGLLAEADEVIARAWALVPRQPRARDVQRLGVARGLLAVKRGDAACARESADVCEARLGKNPDWTFLRACAAEVEAKAAGDAGDAAGRAARFAEAAAGHREVLAMLGRGGYMQVVLAGAGEVGLRLGAALLGAGDPAGAAAAFAEARARGGGERCAIGEAEARLAGGDAAGALRAIEPALAGERPEAWALAARAAKALGADRDAGVFLARARALAGGA
jgi:hypothetical protein